MSSDAEATFLRFLRPISWTASSSVSWLVSDTGLSWDQISGVESANRWRSKAAEDVSAANVPQARSVAANPVRVGQTLPRALVR